MGLGGRDLGRGGSGRACRLVGVLAAVKQEKATAVQDGAAGGGECLADGQNAALGCTLTGPVGGPSVLDCPRADVEDGRSVLRGGVGGGMGVEAAVQSRR